MNDCVLSSCDSSAAMGCIPFGPTALRFSLSLTAFQSPATLEVMVDSGQLPSD
jgi:hypothetical protein